MAYKHKYVVGSTYQFYNNSDSLETNVNFNYWTISIVHSDSFVLVLSDFATLAKDIISGTDYRWYVDPFVFPTIPIGCYRMVIEDTVSGNIINISNIIEVVSDDTDLMLVTFRNAKNILNYNYVTLTEFYNTFHIEMFKRKPLKPEKAEGYDLVDGTFKRVSTTFTKDYEFVTGWFDENEHDATQAAIIHSSLRIAYNNQYNTMSKKDDYDLGWDENYEYKEATFRLQEIDKSSYNKAL